MGAEVEVGLKGTAEENKVAIKNKRYISLIQSTKKNEPVIKARKQVPYRFLTPSLCIVGQLLANIKKK